MQKILISFIDHYPKFKDINSFLIWIRFAHAFCENNHQKVLIREYEFESKGSGMTTILGFEKNINEEIDHNETDLDDDIKLLNYSFNQIQYDNDNF